MLEYLRDFRNKFSSYSRMISPFHPNTGVEHVLLPFPPCKRVPTPQPSVTSALKLQHQAHPVPLHKDPLIHDQMHFPPPPIRLLINSMHSRLLPPPAPYPSALPCSLLPRSPFLASTSKSVSSHLHLLRLLTSRRKTESRKEDLMAGLCSAP